MTACRFIMPCRNLRRVFIVTFLFAVAIISIIVVYNTQFELFPVDAPDDPSANVMTHEARDLTTVTSQQYATTEQPRGTERGMMSVDHIARLGNNMHQYAALRGLAARTGHRTILPPMFSRMSQIFSLSIPVGTNEDMSKTEFIKYMEQVGTPCANSTMRNVTRMGNVNILLHGFFESYKYFENINDVIRKDFTFSHNTTTQVQRFFKENGNNLLTRNHGNATTIGIHIRQGDMKKKDSWFVKRGWTLPPISYFQKAMEYFKSLYNNTVFIICTDDVRWAQENILQNVTHDVIVSRNHAGHVDLAILATCDHVITSRGTFSWWAGWLTTGTTIYYKYYHPKGSMAANYHPKWSYIPQDSKNHWKAMGH